MKRILAILLATMLALSAACVLSFSASAALEGDWTTSRSANDYENDGDYCPAPGYHYDAALGFVIDPPEYAEDRFPFVQMHTKEPVDFLTANNDGEGNSISLKFTVLDYAYDGGEGRDQWIAICLNSQPMATPGSLEYGEGLCILLRGPGNGTAQVQPFYVDNTTGKSFSPAAAFTTVEVPMNDKDQEMYTFTVKYVDGGYVLAVNGYEFVADSTLNKHLDRTFAEGAYVSLIAQTAVKDSKISLAITEWQGDFPVGDDSAEPEIDPRNTAPIADSATVAMNMPAVLWDSTHRDFNTIQLVHGEYVINGDDSVGITAQSVSPYILFNVRPDISYEAADFPYIAVLTRNCHANKGYVYYCAGEILSAENNYSENWDIEDTAYEGGWTLGIMDFSDYNEDGWVGRINSLRVGFNFTEEDIADGEYSSFDVAFIAAFRSPEEARAYTEQYLLSNGYGSIAEPPETTAEETNMPEPEIDWGTVQLAPYETETLQMQGPTQDPDTNMLFQNGLLGELMNNNTFDELFSGCKAIVALPILSVVTIITAAFVFKKKE